EPRWRWDASGDAGRERGPGGTAGGDPEGEHRRVGGDGGERGGGEADRSPVAPRGDHRDARRVLPEDGAQQAGRAGPGGAEVGGCRHEPSFCGWNSGWCGRAATTGAASGPRGGGRGGGAGGGGRGRGGAGRGGAGGGAGGAAGGGRRGGGPAAAGPGAGTAGWVWTCAWRRGRWAASSGT